MLYAFVEGLCGVQDRAHSFQRVRCAPRWVAAGEPEARVEVRYAASGDGFAYDYRHDEDAQTIRLALAPEGTPVQLHVLLPEGARPTAVTQGGAPVAHEAVHVEDSPYVDATVEAGPADTAVQIQYDRAA
jgi:hypothetical protein